MNSLYGNDFHDERHQNTYYSATKILSIVIDLIPNKDSFVDVGCGVGTWLYAAQQLGAKNVQGVDGSWVNKDLLMISPEMFKESDLNTGFSLNKKYDLCISLEVAEHLLPSNASNFISTLTQLSDYVLFSAAHPYQGGVGHINEQWADYWIDLFEREGYVALDVVRREIFLDVKVQQAYRKNVLLYVRKEKLNELNFNHNLSLYIPPEKYLIFFDKITQPGIKHSFHLFLNAMKRRLRK